MTAYPSHRQTPRNSSFHQIIPYLVQSMDNCLGPTRLAMSHLAQVIFILSPYSSLNLYALEDTPQYIFTLARDSRVMIPIRGLRYTLPLLGVVNPLLTTQLPLNTSNYTQSSSNERPLEGQHGLRSKYRISIQDILEHLKSKDTCTIAMMRQSSTFK